jgi:ribonuclease HI
MLTIKAYVDGSFNAYKNIYGSGVVLLLHEGAKPIELSSKGNTPGFVEMRNIGGELWATIVALQACKSTIGVELIELITIYHDYIGIEKFATGEWHPKAPGARLYQAAVSSYLIEMPIKFRKVKAHSGDYYNNIADRLAKEVIEL